MKDTIHTIRRSAHRFFSGTLLSRISGMLRDMSMAYAFGTHPSVAAFMVAFRFAHLLRRLLGEGALQSAFIPEFESLRQENASRAFCFFRDLVRTLTLLLCVLIGITGSGLAAYLSWHPSPSTHHETLYLTLLMLPSLLFICLYGLNASLLQCEKVYFTPSVAPVAFNVIWIIVALNLQHLAVEQAMPWLAYGVILACFCQWFLTFPKTRTILKYQLSTIQKGDASYLSDLKRLIKPLSLGILGVAASQINNAVDSLFALFAEAEGPAFLWYAIRIQQLPLALFGVAIAGAVLPPLSRALKAQRTEEYQHFLHYALYRTWLFILPITALLFVMGDTCVSLLYSRGNFGSHSIIGTTHCLWAYTAGLIPSALVLVLAPASYAQNNYYLPAMASCVTMTLNGLLNTLFIVGLGWGAVSVALATSLSAWVNLLLLTWYLTKQNTSLVALSTVKEGSKIIFITLVALIGTYQMRELWQQLPFFAPHLLTATFGEQLKLFCFQILTFGGIYMVGSYGIRFKIFKPEQKFGIT